jgi:hypothetical protein
MARSCHTRGWRSFFTFVFLGFLAFWTERIALQWFNNRIIIYTVALSAGMVGFTPSSWQSFPMLDEGVWAEARAGNEHLRLFSERNASGVMTSGYNVKAKNWVAPSELVGDIEQGKEKAAGYAEEHLRRIANLELPSLVWKSSRCA